MIQEMKDGGLELTDPENDRKAINSLLSDYKIQLATTMCKKLYECPV
ncbi:hypothetical protein [Bacteroides ihuae]|nr:hypothetical protein [Bacteroides ihuae]